MKKRLNRKKSTGLQNFLTGRVSTHHTAGILNNTELRYPNEPARHKLLDIMGDLALVGHPIKGKVVATRPGHFANTRLAKTYEAGDEESSFQKGYSCL
ncbi:MAG: UDP-3-O-acyl-N-acetylglucosamine deacetylase [Marinilabiliales bacterium]|nr:UDP-3-O-acyl-N-acetylglucosamine deacetylase [Marinilabiliales bacterium]